MIAITAATGSRPSATSTRSTMRLAASAHQAGEKAQTLVVEVAAVSSERP